MLLKHVDPAYFTKELAVDDPHTQTLRIRVNNDMLLTLPYFLQFMLEYCCKKVTKLEIEVQRKAFLNPKNSDEVFLRIPKIQSLKLIANDEIASEED